MTPAELDNLKGLLEWLKNRSAIYRESVKKYKALEEVELTCFYNGKAEALEEAAEKLIVKFKK